MKVARQARWKSVVGMLCALTVVGCNGGGGRASPATSTPPTIGRPDTPPRPVDTSFSGEGSSSLCLLATTFTDRSADLGEPSTAAQLRESLGEAKAAINQAASVAPAEVMADMRVLAQALEELFAALETVEFNAVGIEARALRALQKPEFLTASQRVQSYLRNVCRTG